MGTKIIEATNYIAHNKRIFCDNLNNFFNKLLNRVRRKNNISQEILILENSEYLQSFSES